MDQAGELKAAFRREGSWNNAEIKMLCERKGFLSSVRQALLGFAEIKPIEHLIDLSADPYVPNGWSVVEHQKGYSMKWDSSRVRLYVAREQKRGRIEGNELRKVLASKPVLNANVLDHLLKNPHLIPEEWKGKAVFFWGTIYRDSNGNLCVRCLGWHGAGWDWGYYWLDDRWGATDPAALLAS